MDRILILFCYLSENISRTRATKRRNETITTVSTENSQQPDDLKNNKKQKLDVDTNSQQQQIATITTTNLTSGDLRKKLFEETKMRWMKYIEMIKNVKNILIFFYLHQV